VTDNKGQDGVSQITFFSVVVQIFVAMSIVLTASGKPEDHWFRAFAMIFLALMTVLYTGGLLYLMWQRKAAKGRAAGGEPGAQA
jgi:heme/copper-type cytochrome/quinol oxidase subunit 4